MSPRYQLTVALSLLGVSALLLSGCSTPRPKPERELKIFSVSNRRHAPPPTYNQLRWVQLPSMLPPGELPPGGPMIAQLIQFNLKNITLEKAAKLLAESASYHSYTASTLADKKISLKKLGTIDELGEAIGQEAGIRVVVDHQSREIRFLPQVAETPQFFEPLDDKPVL